MSVSVLYSTSAIATGGRDGSVKTADGAFKATLSTPAELGGAGGDGNNPEQLFAAGYAACFIGAMKVVASQEKIGAISENTQVRAQVGIGPRAAGGFGLTISIEVHLPDLDRKVAEDLVAKAHHVCPYSHATRNNIDVSPTVVDSL